MKGTIVLYISILFLYIGLSSADLIASSKVERCVLDGANQNPEDQALNCTKKMIVSISLNSGQVRTSTHNPRSRNDFFFIPSAGLIPLQ